VLYNILINFILSLSLCTYFCYRNKISIVFISKLTFKCMNWWKLIGFPENETKCRFYQMKSHVIFKSQIFKAKASLLFAVNYMFMIDSSGGNSYTLNWKPNFRLQIWIIIINSLNWIFSQINVISISLISFESFAQINSNQFLYLIKFHDKVIMNFVSLKWKFKK
jgi:hypothetical protein